MSVIVFASSHLYYIFILIAACLLLQSEPCYWHIKAHISAHHQDGVRDV